MALVLVYNLPNSSLNQKISQIIFNAFLDLNLNPEKDGFECFFPKEKEANDIIILVEDISLSESEKKELNRVLNEAIDKHFKMPARCNFAGKYY